MSTTNNMNTRLFIDMDGTLAVWKQAACMAQKSTAHGKSTSGATATGSLRRTSITQSRTDALT